MLYYDFVPAEPAFPAAVHVGWTVDRWASRCGEVGVGVGALISVSSSRRIYIRKRYYRCVVV